jgi:hypothetical protein
MAYGYPKDKGGKIAAGILGAALRAGQRHERNILKHGSIKDKIQHYRLKALSASVVFGFILYLMGPGKGWAGLVIVLIGLLCVGYYLGIAKQYSDSQ